jgi:hypothetical protein
VCLIGYSGGVIASYSFCCEFYSFVDLGEEYATEERWILVGFAVTDWIGKSRIKFYIFITCESLAIDFGG